MSKMSVDLWNAEYQKLQLWVNVKTNGDCTDQYVREHFEDYIEKNDPE